MKALIGLVGGLLLWLGLGAAAAAAPLSAADHADIARVEQYLNGVRTLVAGFIQASQDGGIQHGTFYLSRPGKMRLVYDPPNQSFVVADGLFVFFWDGQLKQQSSAPIGTTLADVILRKDLKLSGDITVTQVAHGPGTLELTVIETKDSGKGSLTLIFEDKPLRLRKWRVIDAEGLTTEVTLVNPQVDVPLDPSLFAFIEPPDAKRSGNR